MSENLAGDVIGFHKTHYDPAMKTTRKAGCEFAEARDVASPMLVTKYLTCTLADADSKTCDASSSFQRITKKIRDEVVFAKSREPFRRSGLWTSLKVILQLELVNRFGAKRGIQLYKLLMLSFMEICCNDGCLKGGGIPAELSIQMIAKVARRLAKLSPFSVDSPSDRDRPHFSHVRKQVEETVRLIREKLDGGWRAAIENVSLSVSSSWSFPNVMITFLIFDL